MRSNVGLGELSERASYTEKTESKKIEIQGLTAARYVLLGERVSTNCATKAFDSSSSSVFCLSLYIYIYITKPFSFLCSIRSPRTLLTYKKLFLSICRFRDISIRLRCSRGFGIAEAFPLIPKFCFCLWGENNKEGSEQNRIAVKFSICKVSVELLSLLIYEIIFLFF